MKITVIIPILNSEDYIQNCLEGLKSQTVRDFEVIFVIDKKTVDASEELIDMATGLNIRKIIQDDDKRVGGARNLGIEAATGDYIWFLDVDDTPMPNYLEVMSGMLDNSDSDFVACNFIYHHPETDLPRFNVVNATAEYGGVDALIAMNEGKISPNVWDKLFRKAFIDEKRIRFEIGFSEDYHFMSEACISSQNVLYTSMPLYVYNLFEQTRSTKKGNEIATRDVEIFEMYSNRVASSAPERHDEFCRASIRHLLRSFTMADRRTCVSLMKKDSIRQAARVCPYMDREMFLLKVWPFMFYSVGSLARRMRYSRKAFLFNPCTQ